MTWIKRLLRPYGCRGCDEVLADMQRRIAALEQGLADLQTAHAADMHEIREQQQVRARGGHKPFHLMRQVAEAAAQMGRR